MWSCRCGSDSVYGAGGFPRPAAPLPFPAMLSRIRIHAFRNYRDETFAPSPGLNLVVGPNGSGKSSLLEAIYVLATGRSFRATRPQSLILDEEPGAVLFAELEHDGVRHRIGMERSRTGLQSLRLDGEDARSLGELARLFPVQVFHPGTVEVVEGGPGGRRRYLDWGLFHVEQSFLPLHRQFRQALSQRNRLLKRGRQLNPRELDVWDRQVAAASGRIDGLRKAYLERLEPEVNRLLHALPELPEVGMELYSGWPDNASLADLMRAERDRDQARGFTGRGAHRADLRLTTGAGPVRDVFSRGQAKSLGYVLVLAQLILLTRDSGKRCLVMVDDLGSELDAAHRAGILRMIGELDQQTIFTALEADSRLLAPLNRDVRMFHVEHGALRVQ